MTRASFYRDVIREFQAAGVPFHIGGAYALMHHTGIKRATGDLDLMVRQQDWPHVERTLHAAGIAVSKPFPHWLGKARSSRGEVDIIFNGGNGLTPVDDVWLARGRPGRVLGFDVQLTPPEELLWTKAFVMERERFDGADVQHLLLALAESLDWAHLRWRFRGHERLLAAHLVLFTFVYPGHAHRLPPDLLTELLGTPEDPAITATPWICRGTLISRAQFLEDVSAWGFLDARRPPFGAMTDEQLDVWTNAIDRRQSRVRTTPSLTPARQVR